MPDIVIPINDDGSASQQADGSLILGDPAALPCCCCPTTTCAYCDDSAMPSFWGVAAAGVAWAYPPDCYSSAVTGGDPSRWFDGTGGIDPLVPRTLYASPFAGCSPEYSALFPEGGPFVRDYNPFFGNCAADTGPYIDLPYIRFAWRLYRFPTKWVAAFTVEGGAPTLVLFYGELPADGDDCRTELVFTNELAGDFSLFDPPDIGGGDWIDCGVGGTATFTPCAPAPDL